MAAMRSDAARSRARILDAARAHPVDDLRLNDLARETGLGVGTVYRHFPTVTALLEALNVDALQELVDRAQRAAASTSPGEEFAGLITRGAELQMTRDGLRELMISDDVSPEIRALRDEFRRSAAVALDAAIDEGRIRPGITMEHIQRLVCGAEHAARLGSGRDQDLLVDIMITGLGGTGDR